MDKYYIDKTILSVMFDTQDEVLLESMNIKVNELLTNTTLSTMKEYMQEKEVSEADINKVMNEEDVDGLTFDDPMVETMLFDPELIKKIEGNINTVIKILYMKYGENLSEEKKKMIDQYIQGKNVELSLSKDKLISGIEDTWVNIILEGIQTGPEEQVEGEATTATTNLTEDEIIDNEDHSTAQPVQNMQQTKPIMNPTNTQVAGQENTQMPNMNLGGALNGNQPPQQPIENTPQQ